MTELLPCPWCGSDIRLSPINVPWSDNEPCWAIWHVDGTKAYEAKCPMEMGGYDTEAEAIAAWNSRAERIYATGGIIAQAECRDVCASISEFTCSSCGFNCDLTSWISLFDGDSGRHRHHHFGTPNYCPNCGARVVGE